jgi:hypothetical protein
MGIRVRASAFAHPKSPHVAAVNERQFVSALQLVLPRKMDDGDGNASTSSEGFADVSEALRRRPRGSNDGVEPSRSNSWDPLRAAMTFASRA